MSSVAADAAIAVTTAWRISRYLALTTFCIGLLVLGIAIFATEPGSTGHRLLKSTGYVAFFGFGFGALWLSQYLVRRILGLFFQVGMDALRSNAPSREAAPLPPTPAPMSDRPPT